MKTATRKPEVTSSVDMSAADILREQGEIQRRAIAESNLYRNILNLVATGEASEDQVQAARIVGQKWNWSFDNDLAVVKELNGYESNYPNGFDFHQKETWNELTSQATAIRDFREAFEKKSHEMESERRRLESANLACCRATERPAVIKREHPHLFGVG